MVLDVFSSSNDSILLIVWVHTLLACRCTELGGVLHHQPDTLSHSHLSGTSPMAKLLTGLPVCRAGPFSVPGNVI